MVDMVRRSILPAASKFAGDTASNAACVLSVSPDSDTSYEQDVIAQVTGLISKTHKTVNSLADANAKAKALQIPEDRAMTYKDTVLPIMEELYNDASHRAVHMSANLLEDDDYLCGVAAAFVEQSNKANGMSITELQGVHPAIRRRALQMWFKAERGATLEAVHLQALLALVESGDKTARVALPTDVSAYCTARGRLSLAKTKQQTMGEYVLPLTLGEQKIANTDISISITPVENPNSADKREGNVLVLMGEWKDLQKALTWRNRREGDVILRGKMHRRIRRLLAERGVPTEMRQALPLLCKGEEILWAPFVGMSDSLKEQIAKGDTSSAYKIEINVPNNAF
jgi:tRNA(Ile)-lysidine synthetase-like protein